MSDAVVAAPSPEKNLPVLRVELRQKEVKGLEGMKPGDAISVEVLGKLKSIELREPYSKSKDDYVGYIEVECEAVDAEAPEVDEGAEFADMAD